MKSICNVFFLAMIICLLGGSAAFGSGSMANSANGNSAIIMASFGTTVPEAVGAITNITDIVRNAYPETEVRITFTSNIIRSIWKERQAEPDTWISRGIPEEVLYVKNFIATVGDLLEDGYTNIVVQPTHMFFMEQSHDLQQYVNGLASIRTMKPRWKPINKIVMGRPALGRPGDLYPYHDDVEAVCETLAKDAEEARQAGAPLVYMGHGNEYWSTGIYAETEKKMRELYPEIKTFIGVVEGAPTLDDLMSRMKHLESKKIILRPFMIVAGDHANNDMAGVEADSWKSVLTEAGYTVDAKLEGLGSNDEFAALFVDHIADVAKDAGILLK